MMKKGSFSTISMEGSLLLAQKLVFSMRLNNYKIQFEENRQQDKKKFLNLNLKGHKNPVSQQNP